MTLYKMTKIEIKELRNRNTVIFTIQQLIQQINALKHNKVNEHNQKTAIALQEQKPYSKQSE